MEAPLMIDKIDKENLLAIPNVVGVGHGFKKIGGIQTHYKAIIVLVKEKLTPDKLDENHVVPRIFNGMITDVIEVGELKALMSEPASELAVEELAEEIDAELIQNVNRQARRRPAVPGMSIGHKKVTAGTFGAVVYDNSTGQPLILSNNHILANSSNGKDGRARIGDSIYQPGTVDGGSKFANIIGKLAKYVTLDEYPKPNEVDCALAKPLKKYLINSEIIGIGEVKGITDPVLGMTVIKSGRTTDVTTGTIKVLDVTSNVDYGGGRVLRFENQIYTTKMSEGGDSGSLVLDENNMAVGLLFAGSSQGTLVNPIKPVLDWLNVKFDKP
jgi:hypothetical protein